MSLQYGGAEETAEILNRKYEVTIDDLTEALINALKRIAQLEKQTSDEEER